MYLKHTEHGNSFANGMQHIGGCLWKARRGALVLVHNWCYGKPVIQSRVGAGIGYCEAPRYYETLSQK